MFNPDGIAPALTYKTDGRVHIEPKPQQLNDGTGLSHSIDANYNKGLCLSAVNKGKRTMVIEQIMKLKDSNRDNPQRFRVYGLNGIAPTLSTMADGGAHPYIPYHDRSDAKVEEQRIRRLTPKECWRLQGFPDWAFDRAKASGVSDTQLYRQAGNSVTVPVVEAIARRLT